MKLADGLLESLPRASVMVKLYSWGVPRLCGNQRCGTLSGTVKLALTTVDALVPAAIALTVRGPEVTFNSGMEIVMVGESAETTDRTARVTLTSQSADWLALRIDVWPTFEISREVSSKNTLPMDARSGWEAGVLSFVDAFGDSVTR